MLSTLLSCIIAPATLCATPPAAKPNAKPTSARILVVPWEWRQQGDPVGNVRVHFADGHAETWTTLGRYLDPHVSKRGGLVGWVKFSARNDYQEPVTSSVRVRFPNGKIKDFHAYFSGPFINEWAFTDHDTALVISSMGRHGPSYYVKYDLQTGAKIDSVERSTNYPDLPPWAKPFDHDGSRAAE